METLERSDSTRRETRRVESPGSLGDFAQQHPELSRSELLAAYSKQIADYRSQLERDAGVGPGGLHEMRVTPDRTASIQSVEADNAQASVV